MPDYLDTPTGAVPTQTQTDDLREVPRPRRNLRSAKKGGAGFESLVAEFLSFRLADDRIERRTKNGTKDRHERPARKTVATSPV